MPAPYRTSVILDQDDLKLLFAANSTTTGVAFAVLTQTATPPEAAAGKAVIGLDGRESLLLIPFGRNANNLTLKQRVSGAQQIAGEWVYTTLCEITATLSSSLTGRSGGSPSDSDLFADTITVDKGIGVVLASPADDTGRASFVAMVGPYDYAIVQTIRNGSATETNALYSTF